MRVFVIEIRVVLLVTALGRLVLFPQRGLGAMGRKAKKTMVPPPPLSWSLPSSSTKRRTFQPDASLMSADDVMADAASLENDASEPTKSASAASSSEPCTTATESPKKKRKKFHYPDESQPTESQLLAAEQGVVAELQYQGEYQDEPTQSEEFQYQGDVAEHRSQLAAEQDSQLLALLAAEQ